MLETVEMHVDSCQLYRYVWPSLHLFEPSREGSHFANWVGAKRDTRNAKNGSMGKRRKWHGAWKEGRHAHGKRADGARGNIKRDGGNHRMERGSPNQEVLGENGEGTPGTWEEKADSRRTIRVNHVLGKRGDGA
jgi:hypothetical protein